MKRLLIGISVLLVLILGIFIYQQLNEPEQDKPFAFDESALFDNAGIKFNKYENQLDNSYVIIPGTDEEISLKNAKAQTMLRGKQIALELVAGDITPSKQGVYAVRRLILTDSVGSEEHYVVLHKINNNDQIEQLGYISLNSDFVGTISVFTNLNGVFVTLSSEQSFETPYVEKDYSGDFIMFKQHYQLTNKGLILNNLQ